VLPNGKMRIAVGVAFVLLVLAALLTQARRVRREPELDHDGTTNLPRCSEEAPKAYSCWLAPGCKWPEWCSVHEHTFCCAER